MWVTRDGVEVSGPNPNIHRDRDSGPAGSNDKSDRERERGDKSGNSDRSADLQLLQVEIYSYYYRDSSQLVIFIYYIVLFTFISLVEACASICSIMSSSSRSG